MAKKSKWAGAFGTTPHTYSAEELQRANSMLARSGLTKKEKKLLDRNKKKKSSGGAGG